jgi:hypothetical protein
VAKAEIDTGVVIIVVYALIATVPPARLSKYPYPAETHVASTTETPIPVADTVRPEKAEADTISAAKVAAVPVPVRARVVPLIAEAEAVTAATSVPKIRAVAETLAAVSVPTVKAATDVPLRFRDPSLNVTGPHGYTETPSQNTATAVETGTTNPEPPEQLIFTSCPPVV